MKGRIHTDSVTREFRLLRNRVESELHAPAVLLVTSATDRDGAGLTAYGLAESLSKTHQRTALVTTSMPPTAEQQLLAPAPSTLRRRASDSLDGGKAKSGGLSVVTISHERLTTISRSNIASLMQELRAEHDYVVVDAGDLPNSGFALLMVASVDAVLVTFLSGRQQTPQDRIMLDTLERTEAKMLGIVMADQDAVDHFAQRDVISENREIAAAKKAGNPLVHRLEIALQRIGKPF